MMVTTLCVCVCVFKEYMCVSILYVFPMVCFPTFACLTVFDVKCKIETVHAGSTLTPVDFYDPGVIRSKSLIQI